MGFNIKIIFIYYFFINILKMSMNINNDKIINISKEIIENYKICDNCLGRLFKRVENDTKNSKIGIKLRKNSNSNKLIDKKNCFLCSGLIKDTNKLALIIINKLKNYEFDTFLIGTIIDENILDKEKEIIDKYQLKYYESIKNEINRELGNILEKKLLKKVNFDNPTIMIIIDTQFHFIKLQIKSLFIYGRYQKIKRGIPQTKWFCRICNGVGCKYCKYKGKLYDDSIEELVSKKLLELTQGEDESFHGAGREDIDVKMLGNGRPFIIEIKNPKKRKINLDFLANQINKNNEKIKVNELKFTNKAEIKKIKEKKYKKIYRVKLISDKNFEMEKLKKVALSLQGKIINQFTPTRVARRRANIIRDRKIYKINIESVKKNEATLKIETQSGTYIKELINGDNGKTKPNISQLIGFPCSVKELDVIGIKE
jgi:tRNA pseudouridine synthase 10